MSAVPQRHPFLDDLAEDVTLVSSILHAPVSGRVQVLKIVKAGASQYLSQTPISHVTLGARSYLEYEVTLAGSKSALGLVSILRNTDNQVTDLNITFSPFGSVLALAKGIREILVADPDTAGLL